MGGHGYVGAGVVTAAEREQRSVTIVSRAGDTRDGRSSVAWPDWVRQLDRHTGPVVWLLDGAKHEEPTRLTEFITTAGPDVHVVLVSTCTVYGNQGDRLCPETAPIALLGRHAQVKFACEQLLARSSLHWSVLRLGALYGPDGRGVRRDRTQTWVQQAATVGTVVVPDPEHWRGWVHRDQAARALWRVVRDGRTGVFNVASSNATFGQAAASAAGAFGATVVAGDGPDLCSYRVDAAAARAVGILDEQSGEDIASTTARAVRAWNDANRRDS